jgi:hypothetical protein
MKKILLLLLLINFAKVEGQINDGMWLRSTFHYRFKTNWALTNEFQYRTQNKVAEINPFLDNRLSSYCMWLIYNYNENAKISLAPFSYFNIHSANLSVQDEISAVKKEFRFSTAFDYDFKKWDKLVLFQRSAFEYRVLEQNQQTRIRTKLGAKIIFTPKLTWVNFVEGFANTSNSIQNHWYDQHRFSTFFEYKVVRDLKIEFGYMFVHRYSYAKKVSWNEHNGMLYVTYTIPSFNTE